MSRFFFSFFLVFLLPLETFASVVISSLLPNPLGDDTLGEYIELRNTGCASVDISGYSLSDLSGKTYILPSGTSISSHSNRSFPYSETKIALNNSGNEAVSLKDTNGNLVDSYNYSGTQRDNVVLTISLTDEICSVPGVTNTGIEIPASAGMTGSTETGTTNTGNIATGTGIIDLVSMSGSVNTGSIQTGSLDNSGAILETPTEAEVTGTGETRMTGSTISTGSLISSGSTSTGEIISPPIETGSLSPIEMYYSDSDANGKIDTLEITYPYTLTGFVNIGNIFLFSRTGGLSSVKIDTATGHVRSGFLSGNILILKLIEGDILKTTLYVDNSTTSDLRLKSSSDLGFRSIGGKIPEDFLLTKSFDEYRKVYSRSLSQIPASAGMTGTGESASGIVENGTISIGTGTTENGITGTSGTNTGNLSMNTNSSGSISLGVTSSGAVFLFPEIIPTIQSPTNAILSGESFICTTSDCRINLTLEPMFSSGFQMKYYQCYFSTGETLILDTDCNPNTYYYTHSGSLTLELREKAHTGNVMTKVFGVEWNVISTISPVNTLPPGVPDTGKPVAIMEFDNKWKEYYFQDGEDTLICYTYTCSVNFTAERSYDPEGSKLSFLWIYGQNDISTSRDPGGRKYGLGDHVITLRVIDETGDYSQIDYRIRVVGPKPKEEKEEKTIKTKKKTEKISASIEPKKKKKTKKIKMMFYSPPKIILQGKSGKMQEENSYTCTYKKKRLCNMNFTLSGTLKGYEYHWILDGEEVHIGKNPKSWKLTPGIHEITLLSYQKNASAISHEEKFTIQVIPEKKKLKKAKKPKKPKVKKSKKPKPLTIIPEVSAGNTDSDASNTSPLALLIFGSGIGLGYIMRRRKI